MYPFVVLPISSCPLVSKVLVEKVSAADAYIIEPFVIDVSPVPPCLHMHSDCFIKIYTFRKLRM